MIGREEIASELRAREILAALTDRLAVDLAGGHRSEEEARQRIERAREQAVALFPGTGDAFDLIYAPRLWDAWRKARRRR